MLLCIDSVEFIIRAKSHPETWKYLKTSVAKKNVTNKISASLNVRMKYADLKNKEKLELLPNQKIKSTDFFDLNFTGKRIAPRKVDCVLAYSRKQTKFPEKEP